jgi:hypothetical protein
MLKVLCHGLVAAVLLCGPFLGCSDKKNPAAEKGAIQKMTEATANEAVDRIRAPIEKARSAAQQQEEKNRELGDAAKQQ